MKKEKIITVVVRIVAAGIAATTFWGCQRKPTPPPVLPDDTAAPTAQATPTTSPSPQISIAPELLDDGLDAALKDLDAVE